MTTTRNYLALLFITFSFQLFAQPQKGDFIISPSNISFNKVGNKITSGDFNSSITSIGLRYGKFLSDKGVLGGRFAYSSQRFKLEGINAFDETANTLGLGVFFYQYFGYGPVRFLLKNDINTSFNLSDVNFVPATSLGSEYLNWQLSPGVSFFLDDRVSLDLDFRLNIFSVRENFTEFFPNELRPDLRLSLNYFFLQDQEAEESVAALNSISAGTMLGSLSGSLFDGEETFFMIGTGGVDYFFRDNLKLGLEVGGFFSKGRFGNLETTTTTRRAALTLAYYLPVIEGVFLRAEGIYEIEARKSLFIDFFSSAERSVNLRTNISTLGVSGGPAFIFGRHKIEPFVAVAGTSYSDKTLGVAEESTLNWAYGFSYEWFISDRLSINPQLTLQPDENSFSSIPIFGIASEVSAVRFESQDFTLSNFGITFKWYLQTGLRE